MASHIHAGWNPLIEALRLRKEVLETVGHAQWVFTVPKMLCPRILSWRPSGFPVHNSVAVEPEDVGSVERLVRYPMRPPVALERMVHDEVAGEVEIRSRPASDGDGEDGGGIVERMDADDVVARVIA